MSLTDELKGIGKITGEAAMLLLGAHMNNLKNDLAESRTRERKLVEELSEWIEKYHKENKDCAVLAQQLITLRQVRKIQKYVGAVGGIIAGFGIPFIISGPLGWGLAATLAGLTLLLTGFWPMKGEEKTK